MNWKALPMHSSYEVSDTGLVRNKKRNKMLNPTVNGSGYKHITIIVKGKRTCLRVHKLVAMLFIGNSPLQVNHKDCNKLNNRVENLEYCTPLENTRHYISMGRANYARGEKSGARKYSRLQIRQVLRKMKRGMTPLQASRETGVHKDIAYLLRRGKIWKDEVSRSCIDRK